LTWARRRQAFGRFARRYATQKAGLVGLGLLVLFVALALLAPVITNSAGLDVIAGLTSGDSVNGGANVDNWMYKLCTFADGAGGDGYYLGVFKGDGINIGANGQWATGKHLNRGGIHFIVGCYQYNSGTNQVGGSFTNDDVVSLWIDPDRSTFGASELDIPIPDAGGMRTNWSTNAIISEFGLRGDEEGNVAETCGLLALDSGDNYIFSPKKFVALVGVQDLVIVETDDALLIAHRKHSQDVGKIVKELAASGQVELI